MYSISFKHTAAQEYKDAIDWYSERSKPAAQKFTQAIEDKLDSVCKDPKKYKNLYKNYHEVSTRKYPYTIVYFLDEIPKSVVVVAIYHQKRHPKKKYRK